MSVELELSTIRDSKIAGYFVKANKDIIESNQDFLNDPVDKFDLLIKEWQLKYNALLLFEQGIIAKIKFATYHDKMIFLLKFN